MLAQVYKAVLRDTGEEVAIKVQRPGVEPVILRDLFIFRSMARFINPICKVESALSRSKHLLGAVPFLWSPCLALALCQPPIGCDTPAAGRHSSVAQNSCHIKGHTAGTYRSYAC